MKIKLLALYLSAIFVSCSNSKDQAFDTFKNNFVNNLWKQFPEWASSQGYHKYDDLLTIPDEKTRKSQLDFTAKYTDSLMNFDIDNLSDNNKTDFYLIKNQLESFIFNTNELKSFEWNPAEYNVCGNFAEILNGNFATLEKRLQDFSKKSLKVADYYKAAQKNIKNPTIEHTQLGIDQNLGGVSVFDIDIIASVEKSKLSKSEKDSILSRSKNASKAVKDYASFLKKLNNSAPTNFRLGKDLYARKFNFDIQSGYSVDEIFKKATDHKTALHDKMFALSQKLWVKYHPTTAKPVDKLQQIKMVIDKISEQHTTPENFQTAIEKQIPELTAFVKQKNLLFIDPKKPLVVRKEPDYMAGVAGASISAPGPYDKNANTYYNVGSMKGWSAEKSESYLREYNDYILQILNIHEAIPGHYTQLVYSNQSPSVIKSIFGNGAMIEGWAVYTEKMMLENGYKNSDEMWLMYYKWNLRSTCNTILDISVHTKNMTEQQAIDLLVNQAFQQAAEADGKWKRVTLTQVQLCSYFTGYSEIFDFRESLKKQLGKDFDLKQFHEKFLSYGSAPVKYIKELYSNN
jgi:uncharacterized protein (DUF885 family)